MNELGTYVINVNIIDIADAILPDDMTNHKEHCFYWKGWGNFWGSELIANDQVRGFKHFMLHGKLRCLLQ